MATGVQDTGLKSTEQAAEPQSLIPPPRVGIKKLLVLPILFALVFVIVDSFQIPHQPRTVAIFGALLGGSSLVGAIVFARFWREYLGIAAGMTIGTAVGAATILPCQGPMCLFFGPLCGILAFRLFRKRKKLAKVRMPSTQSQIELPPNPVSLN